jgi:hypothetical protein
MLPLQHSDFKFILRYEQLIDLIRKLPDTCLHYFIRIQFFQGSVKCSLHSFQRTYDRYLPALREGPPGRATRFLEIGLGCHQAYLGAGVRTWTTFFPTDKLDLHVMEYDKTCAETWYAQQPATIARRVRLHFGDQSDAAQLMAVMNASGAMPPSRALFDVIGINLSFNFVLFGTC